MRPTPRILRATVTGLFIGSALVLHAADPSAVQRDFFEACAQGDEISAMTLLEQGAEPNRLGKDGLSGLMLAARGNQYDVVRVLLWSGAKASLKNDAGKSAMDFCPDPFAQSETVTPDVGQKLLLQMLLRCYAFLEANSRPALADAAPVNPGLILLTEPPVDYSDSRVSKSYYSNQAELKGTSGIDDDQNGFVDDVFGWSVPAKSAYIFKDEHRAMFMQPRDFVTRLFGTFNAAQLGDADGTAKYKLLYSQYENPLAQAHGGQNSGISDGQYLDQLVALSRGTHLAGVALRASQGHATLHTLECTVSSSNTGELSSRQDFLRELAKAAPDLISCANRYAERVRAEEFVRGEMMSRYLQVCGAGVVLLPSKLDTDPDGELKNVREIFAQAHGGTAPATPSPAENRRLRQLREDLHAFRALSLAVMIYENPNVLFIAPAGDEGANNDMSLRAPSNLSRFFSNVITVTATNEQGALLSKSNYGIRSVGVGAAGRNVLSFAPGGIELVLTGSPMAAALTAGAAASVRASFPHVSASNLRDLIEYSSVPNATLAGKTQWTGNVNLERAMTFADLKTPAAWQARAEHARRRGALRSATQCVERGLRLERTAALFHEQGEIALAENRFEAASASFSKAIELEPKNAQHYIRRAVADLALKAKDKFAGDYDVAIELQPGALELIRDYGWGLFNLGEFKRSAELFENLAKTETAKTGSASAEALLGWAAALWESGRKVEALDSFKKAMAASPDFADTKKLHASRKIEAEMRTVDALSAAATKGAAPPPKKPTPTPKPQSIAG